MLPIQTSLYDVFLSIKSNYYLHNLNKNKATGRHRKKAETQRNW